MDVLGPTPPYVMQLSGLIVIDNAGWSVFTKKNCEWRKEKKKRKKRKRGLAEHTGTKHHILLTVLLEEYSKFPLMIYLHVGDYGLKISAYDLKLPFLEGLQTFSIVRLRRRPALYLKYHASQVLPRVCAAD